MESAKKAATSKGRILSEARARDKKIGLPKVSGAVDWQ
jgi:hypothetical protein